jgi:hypothetical protein
MVAIEKLEEKLGEAMGLEIAAQKAVEELGSRVYLMKTECYPSCKKCKPKLKSIN